MPSILAKYCHCATGNTPSSPTTVAAVVGLLGVVECRHSERSIMVVYTAGGRVAWVRFPAFRQTVELVALNVNRDIRAHAIIYSL